MTQKRNFIGKKVGIWIAVKEYTDENQREKLELECGLCGYRKSIQRRSFKLSYKNKCDCQLPRKWQDCLGAKFNQLTVIECPPANSGISKFKCRCDCGNEKWIEAFPVKRGDIKTCGCSKSNLQNKIIGTTINYLTIIGTERVNGKLLYRCNCICGKSCLLPRSPLKSGTQMSCGCFKTTQEYKDRLTSKSRAIGIRSKYRWTKAILNKFNYTCQKCKCNHRLFLTAHHIDSISNNSSKKFDLDNGICLCYNCHHAYHTLYGKIHEGTLFLKEFLSSSLEDLCVKYKIKTEDKKLKSINDLKNSKEIELK